MEAFELPEVTDECEDVSPRCLVGKILAPKLLNKPAVANILLAAWKSRADVVVTPWKENIFLFQFTDLEDRSRVLQEAPWSVMGHLLVLMPLPLGKAIDELDFRWSPYWVQVHGLPLAKMTRAHGEVIGNRIGRLVEVEAPSDGLLIHRSFLRLRVEVDVTKPLLQGFIMYRHDSSGPVGEGLKVYYKYEKLSEFCYDCGRLGHDKMACKFVSREEGLSDYGPNSGPACGLTLLHSLPRCNSADVRMGSVPSASSLHSPISCTVARRQGAAEHVESGTSPPTSHQLATHVEVRSVRSSVVELGDSALLQSACPRPCPPVSPQAPSPDLDSSMPDPAFLSGPSHLRKFQTGPPNEVGTAQTHSNPSSDQVEFSSAAPYFVTEPSDIIQPLSQPMVSRDPLSFRVQELSPSSSPVRLGPPASLTDLSISTAFNCLSLKRPFDGDDQCDSMVQKKLRGTQLELGSVSAKSKALSVVASPPPARILAKRVRRHRKTSLVDIPVQLVEATATSISGGIGPVRMVSVGDTGCWPRFGMSPTAAASGVEPSSNSERVVVGGRRPQASS
ncbi:hypothetical protein LOK49_LG11G00196 [Camellia lanceoleosa]|uniref:Uncharacterized protein n=1 Tax=Camellia lanceoleosa TaxID=1840588 RepID=A0ACC0G3G1_9ERIC|nr:hypothetical protein LOK49_LG11G00196 [Camellia lanceoleosa]